MTQSPIELIYPRNPFPSCLAPKCCCLNYYFYIIITTSDNNNVIHHFGISPANTPSMILPPPTLMGDVMCDDGQTESPTDWLHRTGIRWKSFKFPCSSYQGHTLCLWWRWWGSLRAHLLWNLKCQWSSGVSQSLSFNVDRGGCRPWTAAFNKQSVSVLLLCSIPNWRWSSNIYSLMNLWWAEMCKCMFNNH